MFSKNCSKNLKINDTYKQMSCGLVRAYPLPPKDELKLILRAVAASSQ